MNWFEHHIGDYDKNTSHLTACEDGIYHRLIRRYYDKEAPLPADVNEVKRLARARSREEKSAVAAVLTEFFFLGVDGWHHKVCDEAIAKFRAGEPEREAKQKNEDTRLARHREERANLFKVINLAGEHRAWNTPIADLRELAAKLQAAQPATETATPPATPATQPATATATPATATQPPVPNHQPPPTKDREERAAADPAVPRVSAEVAVVMALKAEGIGACNQGHPDLQALIAAGAEVQNFVSAARSAVAAGKASFPYVLGIVKGQLKDARALAAAGRAAPNTPLNGTSGGQARAARMAEATGQSRPAPGDFIDTEVRDVTPRQLG